MTFSTTVFLFSIIFIGICISRVKINGFSLDLSAVLIVAILFGWLSEVFKFFSDSVKLQTQLDLLSTIGTSIFVSAVGILTGQGLRKGACRKCLSAFIVGWLGVIAGYLLMRLILLLDHSVDKSVMYGVFCGAMTSTPALAAVCETEHVSAEMAVLGYGCAYVPGVLGILFFVQQHKGGANLMKTEVAYRENANVYQGEMVLAGIALCSVLGDCLGRVHIPLLNISIGNTGGILICSLLLGWVMSRKKATYDPAQLSVYRNLGLIFFFVGTGIRAGQALVNAPHLKWLLYGLIMSSVAILIAYSTSRLLWKKSIFEAICISAGALTSTPAIGAVMKKYNTDKVNLLSYSVAYLGALLCIVLLVKL